MKVFGEFCVVLLMAAMSIFVNGIVVSCMWNWFIVPFGAPAIGFWLAAGISLMLSLLTSTNRGGSEDILKLIKDSFAIFISKFILLGFGAIVRLFV